MKKILVMLTVLAMVFTLAAPVFAAEAEDFATVQALQFDVEPEIDGVVTTDEWGSATVTVKYPDNPQSDIRDDTEADTIEYALWLRYTYEGFYVAAMTPDTSHNNSYADNAQCWNGDCFQMRIDPYGCTEDQGLTPNAQRDANFSSEFQEFAFVLGNDGGTYAYCWHGIMADNALTSGDGRYAASNDGSVTCYEAYIPWEELVPDGAIHAGVSLGVSACILTATDGDYENWLEWGTGVINGRDENIYGSNRMVLSEDTVFGGPTLEDPDPENVMTAPPPVEDATGDYAIIYGEDLAKLSGANQLEYEIDDNGYVTFTFKSATNDPFIALDVSKTIKIDAQTYPYIGLYLKTNDSSSGQVFYHCTGSSVQGMTASQCVSLWYEEVEGNQVAVAEMADEWDWEGVVSQLRFDWYDGGPMDTEESYVTLYAVGFFKTYEAAALFQQDVITVDLDPEYLEWVTQGEEEETPEATEAPDATTEAPADDGDATTKAPEEPGTTAKAPAGDDDAGNNGWIIWVIIGVVAVAAVAVVVIFVSKKKK